MMQASPLFSFCLDCFRIFPYFVFSRRISDGHYSIEITFIFLHIHHHHTYVYGGQVHRKITRQKRRTYTPWQCQNVGSPLLLYCCLPRAKRRVRLCARGASLPALFCGFIVSTNRVAPYSAPKQGTTKQPENSSTGIY